MIADNQMTLIGIYNSTTNGHTPALVTALGTTTGATTGFNVIDLNPSLGAANGGEVVDGLEVTVQIAATLTSAGAATVQFQLLQADDTALTTNVQVLKQTDAIAYTVLTAGKRVAMRWARAAPYTPRRYAGLRIVIAGAVLTNGSGQFIAYTGTDTHDLGIDGRGVIFKAAFTAA